MATEIATLEAFLKTELSNISAVVTCVSTRIYNGVAAQDSVFPKLVYTIVPLQDNFGQARTPIQTNCLIDIQIITKIPVPANVDPAVEAIKTKFGSPATFSSGGFRIAIRHDRPISRKSQGVTVGEYLKYVGGTYRAWVS